MSATEACGLGPMQLCLRGGWFQVKPTRKQVIETAPDQAETTREINRGTHICVNSKDTCGCQKKQRINVRGERRRRRTREKGGGGGEGGLCEMGWPRGE